MVSLVTCLVRPYETAYSYISLFDNVCLMLLLLLFVHVRV